MPLAYALQGLGGTPVMAVLWLVALGCMWLLRVVPQEIIWRSFFVHRYRDIFRTPWSRIVASALTFGFMHIVFYHWIPVALTAAGGSLFAWTYEPTSAPVRCGL